MSPPFTLLFNEWMILLTNPDTVEATESLFWGRGWLSVGLSVCLSVSGGEWGASALNSPDPPFPFVARAVALRFRAKTHAAVTRPRFRLRTFSLPRSSLEHAHSHLESRVIDTILKKDLQMDGASLPVDASSTSSSGLNLLLCAVLDSSRSEQLDSSNSDASVSPTPSRNASRRRSVIR
jgi:hypothetical protein